MKTKLQNTEMHTKLTVKYIKLRMSISIIKQDLGQHRKILFQSTYSQSSKELIAPSMNQ